MSEEKTNWLATCKEGFKAWAKNFFAGDDECVNASTVLAVAGYGLGITVICWFVFYLQKDIPPNTTTACGWLLGASGAGFIANQLTRIGGKK